ncbi:MAG TPA: DUF1330 domain-containing protein [Burkholderiales bacterium]|nr:DUF1330 domain-containing protein [Burkholderiales bacterium]
MKGYVIGEVEVRDPSAYEEYRKGVLATIEKFGGRFLVRGGKAEGLEGAKPAGRLVILEFPSFEQAAKWYRSPEYAPLIRMRQGASTGRLVLVEGV